MLLRNAIIFLITVSLFAVALNATGIFSVRLSHQNITAPDIAMVQEITDQPATASDPGIIGNIFGIAGGFIFGIFKSLFSIVFSILGVEGMLQAYNIPAPMITVIEGLLMTIAIISLILLIANRSDKGMS